MSAQLQDMSITWRDRAMCDDDLAEVMLIEQQAYQFPWSEGVFRDCLRMRYVCRVALDSEDCVQGYGLMSCGAGEAHILNLCVSPMRQRTGLGRFLLSRLTNLARQQRLSAIYLEVRPSNPAALALYQSAGFSRIGQRRGYYPAVSGREDAILLALLL